MSDLKSYRVLVTPTSFAKNDPELRTELENSVGEVIYNPTGRPLNAGELLRVIVDIDGYIAGLDEINREVINKAEKLRVIARYGVGVDGVDLEAAREMGIVVTNTPGANSISVAELTVGLMISLARNIPDAAQLTKSGKWPHFGGICIAGKTIGILGFGSIGQKVARLLFGFDCILLAYDPLPDLEKAEQFGVTLVSLDEIIRQSDFLTLHMPLLQDTRNLVDYDFLNGVKQNAFLINTARGELVDEKAVLNALEKGKLAGAAFDVFTNQPPEPDNPLLAHPNVIVTPHIGAHTESAADAMGWGALKDCLAVLEGREPENRVI